tara:strand:- start:1354 stop:1887 length:534 start_codon:yes stop_codon:yes gene_type:complete
MAKKLLKEATVRRFQRLANVAPINEMYNKRDEEMEEGMYGKRDEDEVMKEEEEAAEAPEPAMDLSAEEGGMDGDLELTDEEAQAIIDLGSKLSAAMGDEVPEMDMGGDEPEMDMGDEKEMMEAEDEMEEDLMEALAGINYVPSQTEVVNEVAKRVARRLKAAKLHEAKLNRALGKRR